MTMTKGTRKALLQIGFGVTGRAGGFYDEEDERVDLRSVQALYERGLVFYTVRGGNPMQGMLFLTEEGEALFEEITASAEFAEEARLARQRRW